MQTLIKKRQALLGKLAMSDSFIKGSINCVCSACGRARCICTKKFAAKAYRLTYKDGQQKTQIVYIPRKRLKEIKRLIANYARVRAMIQQTIEINIAIFKKSSES